AAPAASFSLDLGGQSEAFVAIGEDSAEASLLIGLSGQLRVGSKTQELGVWNIEAIPDQAPSIAFADAPAATHRGVLRSQFLASDDYGVTSIALLMSRLGHDDEVERIELMRPVGGATEIDDAAYLDLTPHPWAGLPVVVRLEAVDGLDQRGESEPQEIVLPARPFQHPVARAIIEQRRRLAAEPEARDEIVAALDRLNNSPTLFQNDTAVYLALRSAVRRLLKAETQAALDEIMALLWDTALHLEDGSLSLAERELRELQDALREALAEGASDEELERLMAELERALNEYLDALAQQAQELDPQQQMQPLDPNAMQVQRQDLQQMLDMMKEMIRTGAREAAEQMLAQLQELLENLQVARNGQMQQGEQMMSQLQQMIQRQQELLDQTFDLSRQPGQEGQQGQQGQRGQQGQMGPMQPGARGGQQGQMQPGGQLGEMALDQEALRRALGELMAAIGEAGAQVPRALGEAELAMRAARDALQEGQPGNALDPEAQALDQLRQGGQAMMQEMQRMYGQGQGQMPGQQYGQAPNNRDPLGRSMYNQGGADLWGERVPTELDLGKARAILEELQRRASERQRPVDELDYLHRLLRRF
ncbi:MAG TPA: TIGR02302 family protein, partial [Geminicoccaceae bacterium]|nr:TIGR02302 family protein [Geminicoccaceae bacterium]